MMLGPREQPWQLALDHAPVCLAWCGADRRFRFVNRSYATRFGLQPENLVGKSVPEVLGQAAYEAIGTYIDLVLSGQGVQFEIEVPYERLGRRFMHCVYEPERDGSGLVVGWFAFILDITGGKKTELRLRVKDGVTHALAESATVRDAAPKIQCPTLIFHAKDDPCFPFEEGRLLASLIPNARFVPLASKNHLPFDTEAAWPVFLAELRSFLTGFPTGSRSRDEDAGGKGKSLLTPRQIEILREVGMGQTDKQIARKLSLSPRTVEMHVANALLALKCRTRAEAVRRATELKLTP